MSRYLLDANLSPETTAFLTAELGLDVVDLISLGLSHLPDDEVVELCRRESRWLNTFDLDFGEIHHRRERGKFGVIVLRLVDQTVEAVNKKLFEFFSGAASAIPTEYALVVIDEKRARVSTEP